MLQSSAFPHTACTQFPSTKPPVFNPYLENNHLITHTILGYTVPYCGDFYTELTPGLEIYIGVNTVCFASIWYRVKKRN